jgi:hypothetical protein
MKKIASFSVVALALFLIWAFTFTAHQADIPQSEEKKKRKNFEGYIFLFKNPFWFL